jgi:hypothetical protein
MKHETHRLQPVMVGHHCVGHQQPVAPAVDTVAVEVIAPTPCVTIICGRYSTDTRT